MPERFDLAIVGAGAAGLIAADFALELGARVALLEHERIGGDCTWTGCVPSKSLVKVAAIAAHVRSASRFGITVTEPVIDLARVREYLRECIEHIYAPTAPEALRARGLTVKLGATRFINPHTLEVGGDRLQARRVLLCTGAAPRPPAVSGIDQVPYLTYRDVFENDRLPDSLVVIGGGPLGCEIAQCYQRLGARVTLVAPRLLPRAEEQASELLSRAFAREGLQHVRARAESVRDDGGRIRVQTGAGEAVGEVLLAAVGRMPNLHGLELERAGVRYSERGIDVNARLQTTARHIYAAGDVIGGPQFSHLAGWQAFLAVRNAMLPGAGDVVPAALPEVTYTVPEVAHTGLTETQARERFGRAVRVASLDLAHVDRAVSEGDGHGFIKLVANRSGRVLGATLVAERAGEALAEVTLAIASRLRLRDLALTIHPYPTYNSAIQLLASRMATREALSGFKGTLARRLSRWSLGSGPIA